MDLKVDNLHFSQKRLSPTKKNKTSIFLVQKQKEATARIILASWKRKQKGLLNDHYVWITLNFFDFQIKERYVIIAQFPQFCELYKKVTFQSMPSSIFLIKRISITIMQNNNKSSPARAVKLILITCLAQCIRNFNISSVIPAIQNQSKWIIMKYNVRVT